MLWAMAALPQPNNVFLDVFRQAETRLLAPGEVLISAGQPADQVFNIETGMLMVYRNGSDGRRQVLSFLFRDNFVGLSATDSYFFSVEAVTSARVAVCPRRVLNERLASDPAAEQAFLNMVFRVLEDILDVVYSLGQRTASERLAVFLLYLRHWQRLTDGIADDDDPRLASIALPMSREDIADFLGLKKETVIRSLRELKDQGLVRRLDAHTVAITDLTRLRTLAGISDFASPRRLVQALGR
jgi:CRP/FNR family transcriptional regulator, anaerobic regulatory protein